MIDVTNAEHHGGASLGHRHFWNNPWITTDVMLPLLTDATPTDRGLQFDTGRRVHRFEDDYPDRIGPIARELIRTRLESQGQSRPDGGEASDATSSS